MSLLIDPGGTPTDPSACGVAITPSDTVKIAYNGKPAKTRAVYVGGTGHVTYKDINGNSVLMSAVPVGTILPIQTDQVTSTGTTATLMTALL